MLKEEASKIGYALIILFHAIGMIFADFGKTLRTILPGVMIACLGLAALFTMAPSFVDFIYSPKIESPDSFDAGVLWTAAFSLLVVAAGVVTLIVAWHRYVLLEETDPARGVPPSIRTIGHYFWTAVLINLIALLVMFPVFIPAGMVAVVLGNTSLVSDVVAGIAGLFVAWIITRFSLALPSRALDKAMTFAESWNITKHQKMTILWLVLLLAAIGFVSDWAFSLILSDQLTLLIGLQLIRSLVVILISTSVLSTLYGTLVQDREIKV